MAARTLLRLTLVRHAKTEPGRSGQEDWDRVLEPRGQRDAPEMARRLKQAYEPKPDRVLSSPAVRAITTATIMVRELGISAQKVQQDERLYLASPKDILAVIRELGGRSRHLMVVGHNPGLTEFADRISRERSIDNLPTCAIYTLQFAIKDWSELEWESGVEAELDYPKRSA
jgi:phosphohistidine phosphatase